MRRLVEFVIWSSLCLLFWVGIVVVQPAKRTSTGRRIITFLDNIDLFAFEVREWGLLSACRSWRRWHGK